MKINDFLTGKKQLLSFSQANKVLFAFLFLTLFLVPIVPAQIHRFTYSFLFSGMILLGTQLIANNKRMLVTYTFIAVVMVWVGDIMDLRIIKGISKGINIIMFMFIVVNLVRKVSKAKTVSQIVILESINAYLMTGLVFSIVVAIMMALNPGSFGFNTINTSTIHFDTFYHEYIYYAFITLTTVGYGDVVPLTSEARSLAMMICVTGQLYIAVVIALLVGKYISQQGRSENEMK
jgi:voltage-gated potassium channel